MIAINKKDKLCNLSRLQGVFRLHTYNFSKDSNIEFSIWNVSAWISIAKGAIYAFCCIWSLKTWQDPLFQAQNKFSEWVNPTLNVWLSYLISAKPLDWGLLCTCNQNMQTCHRTDQAWNLQACYTKWEELEAYQWWCKIGREMGTHKGKNRHCKWLVLLVWLDNLD